LGDAKTFIGVVILPGDLKLTPLLLPTGEFQFTILSAEPGRTYVIEGSTNLIDWKLLTNIVSTSTSVQFIDPGSLGLKQRFYRVVSP
jgi:predicted phosphohydrolase